MFPALPIFLSSNAHVQPLAVQILALLATAAAVATLLRRLNLQVIPGYLLAGVLVGPFALKLVSDVSGVKSVADLAVMLLMFTIGMELDISGNRRGFASILGIGAGSTVAVLVFIAGLLWGSGLDFSSALVLAMAATMSSTAVLVRTLLARREGKTTHGRIALGVSIVQDIAAVVIMALIPVIARSANGSVPTTDGGESSGLPHWLDIGSTVMLALGVVAAIVLVGRFVLPRILFYVSRVGSQELVLVVSAAMALGAAISTAFAGLSPEMGAFLAGLMLGATPYRYQLTGQFAPMRDILMAVFFTAVGMQVDPALVLDRWWIVLLCGGGVVAVKAMLIGISTWAGGASAPTSLLSGIYLGNAGEFSLVVIGAARIAGAISDTEAGVAIASVILSLVVSPMLFSASHRWADRLVRVRAAPWSRMSALRESSVAPGTQGGVTSDAPGEAEASVLSRVVIAGFGVVGRSLADRFSVMGVAVTVIELNPRTVQKQTDLGRSVVYGDVTNAEVLESAGIRHADAVFITIPDDEATMRACREIRELDPTIYIAARTSFLSGKFIAHQLGADLVTVEEIATAHAMEADVLNNLHEILRRKMDRDEQAAAGSIPSGS